jgi:hypothetical protein
MQLVNLDPDLVLAVMMLCQPSTQAPRIAKLMDRVGIDNNGAMFIVPVAV